MALPENPITRKEAYLAKIAGQEVQIPDVPITREEAYLNEIAKNGGGGGGYVLPTATASRLGGVKIGSGINVEEDGTISASGGGGTDDYNDLDNQPQINGVTLSGNKTTNDLGITASGVGAIPSTDKGANGGVAELDSNGKVPSSQLPSYVDDVLSYSSQSAFPATGETGKIYIAEDTNKTYRWSGSAYAEISASLALGETSSTAYRGDRGKTAYDHSQTTGNPHGTTASDVGLGNVPNVATDDQTPTFTEASTRNNIVSGEKLSVILGKISKFFNDLKTVAFSGSYTDLTNTPTIPTSAGDISYDNTYSGLTATDVQDAVDELAESYPATQVMMSDGETSVEEALDKVDKIRIVLSGEITASTAKEFFLTLMQTINALNLSLGKCCFVKCTWSNNWNCCGYVCKTSNNYITFNITPYSGSYLYCGCYTISSNSVLVYRYAGTAL